MHKQAKYCLCQILPAAARLLFARIAPLLSAQIGSRFPASISAGGQIRYIAARGL
jgi:hypothetical protein